LWATYVITQCLYLFYLIKFASLVFTQVVLHPTDEATLDSGFARRSYDYLTNGGWNLT
jgi:hypothetical protein